MKKEKGLETEKRERLQRASGDKVVYRILSAGIGVGLFFVLYMSSSLSAVETVQEVFSSSFWINLGWMVAICFVSDYGGKLLGFAALQAIYRKPTSNFAESNTLNVGGFMVHLVEVMMRALIFMLGAAQVIQSSLFADQTLWTLMLTYVIIKIAIAAIARLAVGGIV